MPLEIVRNDITKMIVDAIVNAANTSLKMGGGVCGAIFDAAGADELQAECGKIGGCVVGQAVITKGYNLPSKFIIHTAGPVWQGGTNNESELLASSYRNSLELAQQYNCESIAFPLISSGIFGYPKEEALNVAMSAIGEFLSRNDMMVYLVVFDKNSFKISETLFSTIEKFIDDNYVEEHMFFRQSSNLNQPDFLVKEDNLQVKKLSHPFIVSEESEAIDQKSYNDAAITKYSISPDHEAPAKVSKDKKKNLKDLVSHLDESFSQMLLRLIDEKGMTDVETYKKANIDRKLFSKIRSGNGYNPSKATAIAFAIALNLSLDDTRDLLGKAGYSLSHSNVFDIIIEFFILENNYNIYEINEALFSFDQSLLV